MPHEQQGNTLLRHIMELHMNKQIKTIRYNQVKEIVPLSRTQLWRLELEKKFPARIKLTENTVAWDKAEVLAWLQQRKEASNA